MKMLFRVVVLLLVFFFTLTNGYSQSLKAWKKKKKATMYVSIGGSINAMNYVGDLDPGPSFANPAIRFTRPDFTLFMMRRMRPRVSYRGAISYGKIKGDDKVSDVVGDDRFRKIRNLSFESNILEAKADVIFDLYENRKEYRHRVTFTPYGFFGLAYFHFDPVATYGGEKYHLHKLKLEGKNYSLHQIALPVGFGFRYKIAQNWDVSFEMGWRFTMTDYLDDVSTKYRDRASYSDPIAQALADRSMEGIVYTSDGTIVSTPRDPALYDMLQKMGYKKVLLDKNGGAYFPGFGHAGDQRGDRNKDWYIVTGFHLAYILPVKVVCPKFR